MPNYFYVKNGGAASAGSGVFGTQQTGAWSGTTTDYYNSLQDAIDDSVTTPGHGDFICISNANPLSTATAFVYDNAPSGAGAGVTIVCVDDANRENAAVASSALYYITGGASDLRLCQTTSGRVNYYGVYLKSDDDIFIQATACVVTIIKSKLEVTGSGDVLRLGDTSVTSPSISFYDVDLIMPSGSNIALRNGVYFRWFGGSISGGKLDLFNEAVSTSGGCFAEVVGVNLSALTDSLLNDSTDGAGDGSFDLKFSRCQLASGVEYVDSTATITFGQRITVTNSAHDASAEYQYYVREESCIAEDDTSFYRTNSVGYPSGTKVSIKVTTSANVSSSKPFYFDLPTVYADLTSTSTDLLRYYILCADALTDKDIWLVAIYPDGTNIYVPNKEVSSTLTDIADAFDPFRTGTTLTTNTEGWNGYTSQNRYQIDVDTSGDPGAKCVPIIRCFVAKASVSSNPIYICVTPDLV